MYTSMEQNKNEPYEGTYPKGRMFSHVLISICHITAIYQSGSFLPNVDLCLKEAAEEGLLRWNVPNIPRSSFCIFASSFPSPRSSLS